MSKLLLVVALLGCLVAASMGESVVASLKEKVEAGQGAAPCDKAAPPAPAAPRQFLDIRLPVVVDDYHPPVGGFNPSHIDDKEVDVAARKILREIQQAEAEAKANGTDDPNPAGSAGILTTEEHKALKQLLLDADILVRAAAKSLSENGRVEVDAAKKVATSAVNKAAALEKKANNQPASAPINKVAAAAAAATVAAPAPASTQAKTSAATASSKAIKRVGAPAPVAQAKTAAPSQSAKAVKRG
jgi:hypothetical protein